MTVACNAVAPPLGSLDAHSDLPSTPNPTLRFYADLHVHSKYSRATSRDLDLEHLALWAQAQGHPRGGHRRLHPPGVVAGAQDKLEPAEPGLFRLKPEIETAVDERLPASCRGRCASCWRSRSPPSTRRSTRGDKTRKVHHLIYAAEMDTASRFRDKLGSIGNIASDGRPILGLDSRASAGDHPRVGPRRLPRAGAYLDAVVLRHGLEVGLRSVDDCYGDLAEHIFAVETGLSSDPPMNWRVSHLDRFTLVSNSDAHSPPILGREACVFDCELDYFAMRQALETRDGWGGTIEFFPEEGKYHLDGHRKCGVRLRAAARPGSGRAAARRAASAVTVGVLHRVETWPTAPTRIVPTRCRLSAAWCSCRR